jgi:long-chain acyl-CoA synthetase
VTDNFFHEDFVIIHNDGKKIRKAELLNSCDDFAQKLNNECLILLCCSNQIADLVVYFQCLRQRIPVMLVSEEITDKVLHDLIMNFKPAYVVTQKKLTHFNRCELLNKNIYHTLYEEKVHPEINILMTTSGSTGTAKFVKLSIENIQSNTKDITSYLKLTNKDNSITSLPMYYTYGLTIINTSAFSGGNLVLTNSSIAQKEFWELLEQYSVTNLAGVPYTFEILKSMRFFRRNRPNLRFITQAGGKLDVQIAEDLLNYCRLYEKELFLMYGQAEASPRISYVPPNQAAAKYLTVGISVPSGKIDILDPDESGIGEVVFTGPNVFGGYATSAMDLLDFNFSSRLETGDIGYLDDDGYLVLTGRKKRFIKLFGHRIGLDELEHHLIRTFADHTFICGGSDNRLIVKYLGNDFSRDLLNHLTELLNVNAKAIEVKKIDEVPRNAYGKIMYE